MTTGVIVGKFYPPHRGHRFLIDTAASQVDHLTVLVCDHPSQVIPALLRAEWIKETHPGVSVVISPDDLPNEPGPWGQRTIELLGKSPDFVFSSEDYGDAYAAAMGSKHVQVDKARIAVPISATRIREDALANWDYLEPCVRAYFVRRVVLIGVESTGKSTLAQQLAKAFNTTWVPEYGREYSLTKTGPWRTEEFVHIAAEQQRQENESARVANKILICDTNAFATCVWHRRYIGHYSPEVDEIGLTDKADLYLLAQPDFSFVQDGTRDGEHIRNDMHGWFEERLGMCNVPQVRLFGSAKSRKECALKEIATIFSLRSQRE